MGMPRFLGLILVVGLAACSAGTGAVRRRPGANVTLPVAITAKEALVKGAACLVAQRLDSTQGSSPTAPKTAATTLCRTVGPVTPPLTSGSALPR